MIHLAIRAWKGLQIPLVGHEFAEGLENLELGMLSYRKMYIFIQFLKFDLQIKFKQ